MGVVSTSLRTVILICLKGSLYYDRVPLLFKEMTGSSYSVWVAIFREGSFYFACGNHAKVIMPNVANVFVGLVHVDKLLFFFCF